METAPNGVRGAELLVNLFGYWPSFHDAEVLQFTLTRFEKADSQRPTAECVIYAFEMTNEVSANGVYVIKNNVWVTFRFTDIVQIELSDFNHQNALWELSVVNVAERQMERIKFEVRFSASFGLEASFQCSGVEVVKVQPCDAEGNAVNEAA